MNILPKGSLTVVLATITTSVLILLTGTTIAETNKAKVSISSPENKLEKPVVESVYMTDSSTVSDQEKTSSELINTSVNDKLQKSETELFPPPPGPFFGSDDMDKPEAKKHAPPKPPTAPVLSVSKAMGKSNTIKLTAPTASALIVKKPQIEFKPMIPSLDSKVLLGGAPTMPKKTLIAPKLQGSQIKSLSKKPSFNKVFPKPLVQAISRPNIRKNIGKAPLRSDKPIWMKKVPETPVIKAGPPKKQHSKGFVNSISSHEQKATALPQRYMYMPAPMFAPNYSYPQAPVYGGYYYAPAPQQFMMPPMNYGNNFVPHNQQKQAKGNVK